MLTAPSEKPQQHGFRGGDHHLVTNAYTNTMQCYPFSGLKMWEIPSLLVGQTNNWHIIGGDTPPGLYVIGEIYKDYEEVTKNNPPYSRQRATYGWYSFDLVSLSDGELATGRAGIMIHGGGTALGWDKAWSPKQPLLPTLGCIRCHNLDLLEKILPLTRSGRVFISVYQD